MIKNWKITIAFILGSIIVSILSGALADNTIHNAGGVIGIITGSTLVIFLIPLLLTYFLKLIMKLIKDDLKGNGFVAAYAIAWVFIAFLAIQSAYL